MTKQTCLNRMSRAASTIASANKEISSLKKKIKTIEQCIKSTANYEKSFNSIMNADKSNYKAIQEWKGQRRTLCNKEIADLFSEEKNYKKDVFTIPTKDMQNELNRLKNQLTEAEDVRDDARSTLSYYSSIYNSL